MKASSLLSFSQALGLIGLVVTPVLGDTLEGLLHARGEEEWTPSIKYVPEIRGISGRQITTSCATPGWIPCTAYLSDRGCRPPGGTCCIDGNYCENGKDCVTVTGSAQGGCCTRGLTCTGSSRQCQSGGSSLCPEQDFCCANAYVCGHSTTGTGSSCLVNTFVGPTSTRASTTRTTTSRSTTSRTPTPTAATSSPQTLSTDVNAGAIAGGVIGGVVLLALIGVFIWFRRKRAMADAAVLAAGRANGPNGQVPPGGMVGPGGMNYAASGTVQGSPMMEAKYGVSPMVAGLSYSGTPEIHNEPNAGAYGGYSSPHPSQAPLRPTSFFDSNGNPVPYHPFASGADPARPSSVATSGSFPTAYAGIGAGAMMNGPGQFPASPSPGSGYSGVPEVHSVGPGVGARFPNPTPPSPTQRFSGFSENSSIAPPIHSMTPGGGGNLPSGASSPGTPGQGPGVGGFYYNASATPSAALPTGASMGGFNPSIAASSPTAQRFSTATGAMAAYYQPSTGPSTPLTGNSEQGLLSNAQAQGQGSSSGGGAAGARGLPSLPDNGKRQW